MTRRTTSSWFPTQGSRIQGMRVGAKCTVMVYGTTSSGKSHVMFSCGKQPEIVYRALRDRLDGGAGCAGSEGGEEEDVGFGVGLFEQVAMLEIYDLLVGSGDSAKGNAPRLKVMVKKAKNATYISGNEAGKISKEVAKVEKRHTVKSMLYNERSSRSHCMIILDVPSVGGRLMLVNWLALRTYKLQAKLDLKPRCRGLKFLKTN